MKAFIAALATIAASATGAAASSRTVTFEVANVDCAVCPITVRIALERVPGDTAAKVDFRTRRAVVTFDPDRTSPAALTEATTAAGYPSSVTPAR